MIPTPSTIPTSIYTSSEAIKEKLRETAQAFGRDIPIPTYLPEEYAITNVQFIQPQYSYDHVELIIAATGKLDITMSITWYHGVFRILPTSDNYQYFRFSDGNGTYDSVVLNYHSDHNALWWDWVPETLSLNDPRPLVYYEMVLSTNTSVPVEELVNIARFVRIP
jgi:hypothetical protein